MVFLGFEDGVDVGFDDGVGDDAVGADVGFDVDSFGLRSGTSASVNNHSQTSFPCSSYCKLLHPIYSEQVCQKNVDGNRIHVVFKHQLLPLQNQTQKSQI